MSASRKLYNAMAARFKSVQPPETSTSRVGWRVAVTMAALAFQDDNAGFDTRRFLRASGFTDGELLGVFRVD